MWRYKNNPGFIGISSVGKEGGAYGTIHLSYPEEVHRSTVLGDREAFWEW